MGIHHELLVSPQVEEPARGIVRARGKGVAIGEELHGGGKKETKNTNGFRFDLSASQQSTAKEAAPL